MPARGNWLRTGPGTTAGIRRVPGLVTTAALEAECKVQLRRRPDTRLEIAIGPAAGFRWISSSGAAMQVTYATVPPPGRFSRAMLVTAGAALLGVSCGNTVAVYGAPSFDAGSPTDAANDAPASDK